MPSSWVSALHHSITFYNALNQHESRFIELSCLGLVTFRQKCLEKCLKIIESKSKVRQSRNKAVVAKMSTSSSTPAISSDVAELKDMVRALIQDRKNQTPSSAPVKAVEQSRCGNFTQARFGLVTLDGFKPNSTSCFLPFWNSSWQHDVTNPKEDLIRVPKASIPISTERNDERRKEKKAN
ncbi:hypothetical protein Tco_0497758 [Tanacetum coccineum]